MGGKQVMALAVGAGLTLVGCGLDGGGEVVEAEGAEQVAQSERQPGDGKKAQDADVVAAEKRAEQAEKRARQAERKAEEAEAKVAAAKTENQGPGEDAIAEEMIQEPEIQRMALDIGWESVTQAERDDVCAGWVMGGQVRELILEVMIEAAEGVIERDIAEVYLDEKCA